MQHAGQAHEIQFLQYRLQVVETWPESDRKQIVMHAIAQRLAIVTPAQDLA